ncbi:MAG TPA: sulfatase-like hydrolase/transferase [Thermoanaerobaculia bacterium]|nr:sulfatase-like hydrolase/transferase [Thermoanaerobaculia bacterium]
MRYSSLRVPLRHGLRALPLAAATALFAGLALGLALWAAAPAPAGGAAHQPPNLVLITLDTTRADHLGAWGWPYARTPALDALAARGTRFSRCDTAAPITLVSHATLMTGLFPPRHGVRDNGTFVLPARVETIAFRLRERGYDTAAVVSAVVLARRQGLDQGFRIYDDDLGAGYAAGTVVSERQAEATTAAAAAALAHLKPPFFLWVHYFDPHEEYRPPTRFADLARGPHRLYDGEIAYMDEQIGELLRKLPAGTDVVAVGDHGEMLGDHGELTHGLLLFEGVRRVPLILAGPGVPAGQNRDCLVRTADVTPTLLELAGIAPPKGPAALDGLSLLPLLAGGRAAGCSRQTYSESFLPFFAYKWYPLRALANERFLFLQAPRPGLYDLDPRAAGGAEGADLAAAQPAAVRRFREDLRGFLKARGEPLDPSVRAENVLTEEQRKQLASLGYAGTGGGGAVTGSLPDPRAMTDVAQALHRAAEEVQQGHCPAALPELQKIVQRDPRNFPALDLAGLCLKEAGRVESALALFERAAKENELSPVPVANAAGAYLALGRKKEAEREYRRALALDPTLPEAAGNLARLLRERGERKESTAILDAALAGGAHSPEIYLERGVARAEAGNLAGALADFREAARRNPANPVPLEDAARAAYQLHELRASSQYYEQLLRLTPGRRDLWKTLGALYLELDDSTDALRAFRQALRLEVEPGERQKLEEMVKELGG